MEARSIEELIEIAVRLMLACPRKMGDERPLTVQEDERLAEIAGPLSDEDWMRLYAVSLIMYTPERVAEILT